MVIIMNERQKRFVDEYIICANATQAAIRAGYSKRSARVIGQENLLKPAISEAIKERLGQMESERLMTAQEVLIFLSDVVRGQVTEKFITPSGKQFDIPLKGCDRIAAADKLLKVFGEYKDKVEVEMTASEKFMQALIEIDKELAEESAREPS